MPLLKASRVLKQFGGVVAVDGFSLAIDAEQVVGLIGPNGAGKSTFMNIVSGLYRADEGEISLRDRAIHTLGPSQIARLGVGRTFQVPRTFRRLNVLDNVLVPVAHREVLGRRVRGRAQELLELVNLAGKADMYAGELSGGQQKLLELARALMPEPDLILMDEPFAGVHPELKQALIKAIRITNAEKGTSFLIVSHEMPVVAALCQWLHAMHLGRNYLEGPPEQVVNDERLVDIYLGDGEVVGREGPG